MLKYKSTNKYPSLERQDAYEKFGYIFDSLFNNSELWDIMEKDFLPKGTIIEDQDGNQLIFTGKSFQIYYTDINTDEQYVGLCKGDKWFIVDIDESELEELI